MEPNRISDDFELMLANAAHIKNVPGRAIGCQRRHVEIADRRAFAGMISATLAYFVPGAASWELRSLLRPCWRTREQTRDPSRIDAEEAKIKLYGLGQRHPGPSGVRGVAG